MEKIKFRAWDIEENRMVYNFQWILYENSKHMSGGYHATVSFNGKPDGRDKVQGQPSHSRRFIAEQFTGLIDKNGKGIYEGDIVEDRIDGLYANYYTIMFGNPNSHDWTGATFYMHRISFKNFMDVYVDTNVAVIGNIHENPELLNITEEN